MRNAIVPYIKRFEDSVAKFLASFPQKPTRIIAFDPGRSNLAIAFLDIENNSYLTSKIEIPDEIITIYGKLRYLEHTVEHWLTQFRPEVIFKEGVSHGETFGVAEAGRVQYIIERLAIDHGIPIMTIQNSSMRSFLKASGGEKGASKSDVKLRVYQRFGVEFGSEDETDAYAIAQIGLAILSGEYVVNKKK